MGSPSPPSAPNYSNFGQANNSFSQGLTGLGNYASQGNQFVNNITQNPYASGYGQAAGVAAGDYGTLSGNAMSASGQLYGAGNTALGAGDAILQAGFDPQQQLYNSTLNQEQQQTGAQLAATGVGATPYGASVMGQDNSNFNMNWQNNQLGREATAANAYDGLDSTAQSDYAAGGQQGQLGANSALMQGQLPYDVRNQINQNNLGALSAGQGLYSAQTGAAGQYMGLANQGFQNQQQVYQDQLQQNQALWGDVGQVAGMGLSAGLGGFGGFGGGSSLFSSLFGGSAQGVGAFQTAESAALSGNG